MRLPFQLDRYTLVEQIGAGAFGQVYRSEVRGDMGFVSEFAVKVLDAGVVARNPNVARAMAEEARLLSRLDHPNIVKVIDFKSLDHHVLGAVYFMVMEYVRGVDVSDLIHRLAEIGRAVPATAVLHMGLMVSDALSHAHALLDRNGQPLGLVHRDLKPQNLMVNFRGQVKVLDFGIAKAKAHRLAVETQEGQTKGTVFYMSPEQLAGEALDGRSDLYSLGTILFELILGRRLLDVEVNNPADLARAMHQAFDLDVEGRLGHLRAHLERGGCGELPSEAVEGWIALLRALLQKDARYRPDSARILSQQLEWLRARHPPAEQRDFWVQQVEAVAASRTPAPRNPAVESVDDLPSTQLRGFGSNTREFFGLDGGDVVEEETVPYIAQRVPVPETTRTMSSVSGSVRAWGTAAMQQIGPLPALLEQIRERETQAAVAAHSGELAAGGGGAHRSPTLEPTAVNRRADAATPVLGVSAVSVAGPAVIPASLHPARPAPTAILGQQRTAGGLGVEPSLKPARMRKKAPSGPSRRILGAVGLGLAGLLLVLLALVMQDRDDGAAPPPEPTPAAVAAPEASPQPTGLPPDLRLDRAEPLSPQEAAGPVEPTPGGPTRSAATTPPERLSNLGGPAPSRQAPAPASAPVVPVPVEATIPAPAAAPATPLTGMLHVSARPRCKVEIDGKPRGTTDETRRGVELPVGTYSVRFVCDDEAECSKFTRKSAKKTLVVEAGKSNFFAADLYDLNAGGPK